MSRHVNSGGGFRRALVVGLGSSGRAVARQLAVEGVEVVVVEDNPRPSTAAEAAALGVEVVLQPDLAQLEALVAASDLVVPSPGVPPRHPGFTVAAAAGVPVLSEIELAAHRARCPIVAVTGTNGKTTVTSLVASMLQMAGISAVAAGNIGVPLIEAVTSDAEVIVAEVSSFQLEFVDRFHPAVAVWLNLAPDHLDWHPDTASYAAAKERIWRRQSRDDVAVVNADDPVVVAAAASAPSRVVTFGTGAGPGRRPDLSVSGGWLVAGDDRLLAVDELPRALPHDLTNALAASAAALAAGARLDDVAAALRSFVVPPHRLTLVAEADGVRWYDDSKATNPHAAATAVGAFGSVVLLAGGRNKGLDLSELARASEGRVRTVVAFGEAAGEVEAAFAGRTPTLRARSMDEAVALAAGAARPGDVVLLSPGCASFDWYESYAARGDHFAAAALDLLGSRGR